MASPAPLAPLRIGVIGGGPAGLVTLKYLSTLQQHFPLLAPVDCRLYDAATTLGGVFSSKIYEDAELVSSKYLTAFSDFRLPDLLPDFLPAVRYAQYLCDYAQHFGLNRKIILGTRVTGVRKTTPGSKWVIEISSETGTHEWECDAVAVCTGMHDSAVVPVLAGSEVVLNQAHSSNIKTREDFPADGTVVVFGAGETGLDMAWLAVTSRAKRVVLSTRDGFFCGPKVRPEKVTILKCSLNPPIQIIPTPRVCGLPRHMLKSHNKPVDCSTASLFDTAYVPPILQRSPLLWWYYNAWIKVMHSTISGTHAGPDQWVGNMHKERKHVKSRKCIRS